MIDTVAHGTVWYVNIAIMFTMLGLACGNYATSIIYRMPLGLKIPNDPPYCDTCRHYLEPRDLFPFFSWLFNRGKCRYCGVKITSLYAVVEWSSVMLFVLGAFQLGISETLVLTLILGTFYIIIASHYYQQGRFYIQMLLSLAGVAGMLRVLHEGAISGLVKGCYWGLIVGMIPWGWRCWKAKKRLPYPETALLPVMAGASLGAAMMPDFLLYAGIWWCAVLALGKQRNDEAMQRSSGVIATAIAVILLLLYPQTFSPVWHSLRVAILGH
jgi:prepilin signal peptidase PulO-like enzyme (type II secretory pathway)